MMDGRIPDAHPYLVEVVGTAGAGKSTLTRSIHGREPEWRIARFINARDPGDLRYLVHAVPGLLPIIAHGLRRRPRLTWREFKLLGYVTEWPRALDRTSQHRGVRLLDQGPIYALVRLKANAGHLTTGPAFERWWDRMLEAWAARLDAVVYLDAEDGVLWSRINERAQPHQTKGEAAAVGRRFTARYRQLFEEVLGRIGSADGPRIVRFDTSTATGEQIAAELISILAAGGVATGGPRP